MTSVVDVNRHLTLDDFKKIFDPYSAQHMFNIWLECNMIEGVFRLRLATNELLAWNRAMYINLDYPDRPQVIPTINYN